jgi:ABC-type oligopeptide transport system substrate-binding subunit
MIRCKAYCLSSNAAVRVSGVALLSVLLMLVACTTSWTTTLLSVQAHSLHELPVLPLTFDLPRYANPQHHLEVRDNIIVVRCVA